MADLDPPYESFEHLQADWAITEYERIFVDLCDDPESSPTLMTPDEARSRLSSLGYKAADYLDIINQRKGGHEHRAYMVVATGDIPRLSWLIDRTFREIDILDGETESIVPFKFDDNMVITALKKRWGQRADQ